jgi:hypothetical protein
LYSFFHRSNSHDQVDVTPAQSFQERMAYVEGVSPRPIQSRDDYFIADELDGLLS